MGAKSRGCWQVGMCFKDCENKNTEKCDECFRFSHYTEKHTTKTCRLCSIGGIKERKIT